MNFFNSRQHDAALSEAFRKEAFETREWAKKSGRALNVPSTDGLRGHAYIEAILADATRADLMTSLERLPFYMDFLQPWLAGDETRRLRLLFEGRARDFHAAPFGVTPGKQITMRFKPEVPLELMIANPYHAYQRLRHGCSLVLFNGAHTIAPNISFETQWRCAKPPIAAIS